MLGGDDAGTAAPQFRLRDCPYSYLLRLLWPRSGVSRNQTIRHRETNQAECAAGLPLPAGAVPTTAPRSTNYGEFEIMTKIFCGLVAATLFLPFVNPTLDARATELPQTMTLQDCLDLALKQNPSILKAQQEIRRTQGVIVETRAPAVPQITASGNGEIIDSHAIDAYPIPGVNTVTRNQEEPWSAQVQISQLVYQGGRVSAALRAAKLSDQIAVLGFQKAVADTILDVRKAFYQILLNKALVDVREQSVTLLKQQLLDAQSRYDVGAVPRFNVLRAEVELANARPPLIRAQNDLRISKESLVKLLAIDSATQTNDFTPINFDGKLVYEHRGWELPTALREGLEHLAEFPHARQQIGVAKANVKVASSGYKPEASVFGNYGWHD